MSELYNIVKGELEAKERPFTWLSDKIGMSRQGLKASLMNNSLRVDVLMQIAESMEKPISFFLNKDLFKDHEEVQGQKGTLSGDVSENVTLKKRIVELEEQLEDKRTIIKILKDQGAVSAYNLVTSKEQRKKDLGSDDFMNPDLDALIKSIDERPFDFNDEDAKWAYLEKVAIERRGEKK